MIDFPDSPTPGQEFTVGNVTWVFNDPVWDIKSHAPLDPPMMYVEFGNKTLPKNSSSTAPPSDFLGMRWLDASSPIDNWTNDPTRFGCPPGGVDNAFPRILQGGRYMFTFEWRPQGPASSGQPHAFGDNFAYRLAAFGPGTLVNGTSPGGLGTSVIAGYFPCTHQRPATHHRKYMTQFNGGVDLVLYLWDATADAVTRSTWGGFLMIEYLGPKVGE